VEWAFRRKKEEGKIEELFNFTFFLLRAVAAYQYFPVKT